ncbi:MAG: GT4 family glycosyltransferase PelF [Chitinophagales bacterium]|nr:GT4 family glycosyltransferase PelF [Chitinophagales bacterium]
MQTSPDTRTDVCLLLEGTWPYVRGGVSSWINQMILGMPEVTFSVVFIGGSRVASPTRQYAIPDNVKHIEEVYLEDTVTNNELP